MAIAAQIIGFPFQAAGYFLLLAILAIPASAIALGRKLSTPASRFGDLFESSFVLVMFLYLLGIPVTYYFLWGWGMFIRLLANGEFLGIFLLFAICPLVPASIFIAFGFILHKLWWVPQLNNHERDSD